MADLVKVLTERALFHRAKGLPLPKIARKIGVTLKWVKEALEHADGERERRAAERADELRERRAARLAAAEAPALQHRQLVEARLRREIEDARGIRLNPKFPVGVPFTRFSECPHKGPIPHGSHDYCCCCDKTGIDWHPAFHRDPRTEPRRKPVVVQPGAAETRQERRARLYANLMSNRSANQAKEREAV
jgi:hypothetical protein